MMKKLLGVFCLLAALVACQSPSTLGSSSVRSRSLSVSWQIGSTTSRTILPSNYASPASYRILLHPTALETDASQDVTNTVTSTSWTADGLSLVAYTITVTGWSGSNADGTELVSGEGSADLSSGTAQNVVIALNYLTSGIGRGQIHLTFSITGVSEVSLSSATLVDPAGTPTSPTLGGTFPTFNYDNNIASAGSYQLFLKFHTATQTAAVSETIIVVPGSTTTSTISLGVADFSASYLPLASFTVSPSSWTGLVGNGQILSVTPNPSTATNSAVTWSSSNASIASVNSNGNVMAVSPGTTTITATSIDNPAVTSLCTVTVVAGLTGTVTTLAGSRGTGAVDGNGHLVGGYVDANGTNALFNMAYKIANCTTNGIVSDGTYLYISDVGNNVIRRIQIGTGDVITFAGSGVAGFGNATGTSATFSMPAGLVIDGNNLYVADAGNAAVRRIDLTTRQVTTVGVTGGAWLDGIVVVGTVLYLSVGMNSEQKIFKMPLSTGIATVLVGGYSGYVDGPAATANFSTPDGMATDGTYLYVCDLGNNRIRKVEIATGNVTTLAGSGASGGADGPGLSATFDYPSGIAISGDSLYVSGWDNEIRKISIGSGVVTTVAGSTTSGYVDSTTGTNARFSQPTGLALSPGDPSRLFVCDTGNNMVRIVQ